MLPISSELCNCKMYQDRSSPCEMDVDEGLELHLSANTKMSRRLQGMK